MTEHPYILVWLVVLTALVLIQILVLLFSEKVREKYRRALPFTRAPENPILSPNASNWWEADAVFNPAALLADGRVHLFYRAMGHDGVSRIGYASSADGIHFDERLTYPVYAPIKGFGIPHEPAGPGTEVYDPANYPSGGGWAGCEDPRAVQIDDKIYMTFVAFDGWGFVRMAMTSLPVQHLRKRRWFWSAPAFLSKPNEVHKNWVFFPERINGKYAVLHTISPEIRIHYVDRLEDFEDEGTFVESTYQRSGRKDHWDNWVRGAGAPPLKTPEGWLLFYHAMDRNDPDKYKVGAMLLDLHDPTKILYRSPEPLLSPDEWYENDWKPGVVYVCGAAIIDGNLLLYYGGGDKYIAAAQAPLADFLAALKGEHNNPIHLARIALEIE